MADREGEMGAIDLIDWANWEPGEKAVVVYITDPAAQKVLLINKLTGLGKGKVNAPGGRLEPGETYPQAAIRECQEEVSLSPLKPEKRMELHFQFTSGYSLYGEAFFADSWEGEPAPSPEAEPFWCDLDKIPYDKMWEDDIHWLPQALGGKKLRGYFVFNEDTLMAYKIEELDSYPSSPKYI
ncbi:MAG: 8-oxo-dGTP diphosphatase [Treponema sp.]|nr:8-oxo-dGTP diphosphatase [Treponema sp.]